MTLKVGCGSFVHFCIELQHNLLLLFVGVVVVVVVVLILENSKRLIHEYKVVKLDVDGLSVKQ